MTLARATAQTSLVDALATTVADLLRATAREIVLPRFGALARHEVSEKSPGEVVTIVDHEAERRLTAALARLLPEARIIGEEACAERPELLGELDGDGFVWLIDPLDGTANFAGGRQPFGMMVALVRDGETEAGWLYDPVADRLCTAWRGGGAAVNDIPLVTRRRTRNRPVAALATQFMAEADRMQCEARGASAFDIVPIPRCAAEHYPRICLGNNDVALFQRTLPWDHAAGVLLLIEAGGRATRWDGSPYRPGDGKTGLLVAGCEQDWSVARSALFDDDAGATDGGRMPIAR